MGGAVSKAFNNVSKAANNTVGNVQKGTQQFGQGAQQLGSGDLKGLQTMGGAVVNTNANLYGNMNDITKEGIDAAYSPLAGTPLYGLTAGNLKGGISSVDGAVRGNIAGIQDLPTDIGAGVQQGLDQIGGAAQGLLSGLGNVLGGGGGGAGGGVSAPQYYKDLAQKQAEYGMNLPDQFQKYEGERFTTPGENTLRGEGILAGRYNQRFSPGGTDPFAGAKTAAEKAANYQSQYAPAELNLQGPTVNTYSNVLSGFGNVNQGMRSATYGNANDGLLGQQDYTTGRSFQDRVQDFMNPYTDQVVNRSLQDINRARQMADLSTMGGAAKSGAFGGSREALMRAENTRNALDQAARTSGELRSAGFNTAANLAQQEELQRLGLTASDLQNLRGYQSAGNLQGQSLTAADLQNVRGLQSQGALAAQGYQAEGALNAQNLGAQSARDVMSFQQQLQQQGNQIAADQARLTEQFRQGAGALNLQGAGALGDLAQAGIADERQRIADMLAAGQAGDMRGQQQADFDYQQFVDETQRFPTQYLNNLQQSGGLAQSLISGPEPQKNPFSGLLSGAGMGLATYGAIAPLSGAAALPAALGMGALGLLAG